LEGFSSAKETGQCSCSC